MNSNDKIDAIREGVKEEWYQTLLKRMAEDVESTKEKLSVYTGRKEDSHSDDLVDKGHIEGIMFAINLPEDVIRELKNEEEGTEKT